MTPAERSPALPRLAPRPRDAHKGDFGLVLAVGGSRGMTGAAALCGAAALRGGAGLVRLAVPDACLEVAAGFEPSYMTVGLPSDRKGRIALAAERELLRWTAGATVVAVGPGLGRSAGLTALICRLYMQLEQPMVIDADGLNALASRPDVLRLPGGPRILTPHPGEFARLVGGERLVPDRRNAAAVKLAAECRAVVILKGHQTFTTDGTQHAVNATGNPGMATGGSGDVLTGLIAALVAQGLAPWDAARLGVHLHGRAGDLAAAELGEESLIASDLPRFLPKAFLEYRRSL